MKKNNMPKGFSPFSWKLVLFCLPCLLWPLALLISPNLLKNPTLSDGQITFMSIFLWVYPFCLAVIARIAYKLHLKHIRQAGYLLLISAVCFYSILFYVGHMGLGL